MVKINDITETVCDLYNEDHYIGEITNSLQLNDVRIQIKEGQLEGYYVIWNGNYRIDIDKFGNLDGWPNGFYDTNEKQLMKLLDWDIIK